MALFMVSLGRGRGLGRGTLAGACLLAVAALTADACEPVDVYSSGTVTVTDTVGRCAVGLKCVHLVAGTNYGCDTADEARRRCSGSNTPQSSCFPVSLTALPVWPNATRHAVQRINLGQCGSVCACTPMQCAARPQSEVNSIAALPDAVYFEGLVGLEELDINGVNNKNVIAVVPRHSFAGARSLRRVSLVENAITRIEADAFAGLPKLEELDLSYNKIGGYVRLPDRAFAGLTSLRDLRLGSNRIGTLPPRLFADLTSLQSLCLYVLFLGECSLCSVSVKLDGSRSSMLPCAGTLHRRARTRQHTCA